MRNFPDENNDAGAEGIISDAPPPLKVEVPPPTLGESIVSPEETVAGQEKEEGNLLDDIPTSPSLPFLAERNSSITFRRSESQLFNEISHNDPTGRLLPRAISRTFFSPFRAGYASKVVGSQGSFSSHKQSAKGDGGGEAERQASGSLDLQASPVASPSTSCRDVGSYFKGVDGPSSNSPQMKWPTEEPSSPLARLPSLVHSAAPPLHFSRLSTEQSPSRMRVNLLKEESSLSKLGRRTSLPGGFGDPLVPDISDRPSARILPPISSGKDNAYTIAQERSSPALSRSTTKVEPRDQKESLSGLPVAFGRTQVLKKAKSHQARFSEGSGDRRPKSDTPPLSSIVSVLGAVPEKLTKTASDPEPPRVTRPQYNAAAMSMQRTVDRANAQLTEACLQEGSWGLPDNIVTAQRIARFSHDLELQSYRELAETMLSSGKIAIQLMASNDYALIPTSTNSPEGSGPKCVDLWSLDPHEVLDARSLVKQAEVKVKAGLGVRFIAATAAEAAYSLPGSNAQLKLIIHCTEAQKDKVASDLASRSFLGFNHTNVFLVIQESNQSGYMFDDKEGQFKRCPASPPETIPLSRGEGFSMLLMSAAEHCWSIARDGSLSPLSLPAQDVLLQMGVEWLISCSVKELSPAGIDISSLAALAYARARGKAGVVAEVALEPSIIQARRHEGIFLCRKQGDGSSSTCSLFTPRDFAAGTDAHKMVTGCLSSQDGVPVIPCSNGRYFFHLPSLKTALTSSVFSPRLTLSPSPPTLVNLMLEIGDLFPHLPHPQLRESKGRILALGKAGAASPNLLQITRQQDSQLQTALIVRGGNIQTPRRIFIVLIEKSQATRVAVNLAMSLAKCETDSIHLLTIRASDAERLSGKESLSSHVHQVQFSVPTPVREVVLALSPGDLLLDVLDNYVSQCAASTKSPEQHGNVVFVMGFNAASEGSTVVAIMRKLVSRIPVMMVTSSSETSIGSYSSLAMSPTLTPVKAALLAFDFTNSRSTFELMVNNGLLLGERGDELTLFTPPGSAKQVVVDAYSKAAHACRIAFQPPFVLDSVPQGSQASPLGISGIDDSISSGVDETKVGLLAIQLQQSQAKSLPPSVLSLLASSHAAVMFVSQP
jgi:hypothetical protein